MMTPYKHKQRDSIMKKPFSFECINCRKVVTEKFSPIMLEMVKHSGACCDACCNGDSAYYASPIYQAFEKAEKNRHW